MNNTAYILVCERKWWMFIINCKSLIYIGGWGLHNDSGFCSFCLTDTVQKNCGGVIVGVITSRTNSMLYYQCSHPNRTPAWQLKTARPRMKYCKQEVKIQRWKPDTYLHMCVTWISVSKCLNFFKTQPSRSHRADSKRPCLSRKS